MRQPTIPAPVAPARRPALRLPPGATDCHAHVFGSQARYPLLPDTHFVPQETPWPDYAAMLRSIGCERAVLVQPSVYGTDNTAIEHTLAAADEMQLRAVAVVAPEVCRRRARATACARVPRDTHQHRRADARPAAGARPQNWRLEFATWGGIFSSTQTSTSTRKSAMRSPRSRFPS